jgi:hypothetical protein
MKEMVAERDISIDHSTIHRWVVHFSPVLLNCFNRRKRAVGSKWHMDETYIKVRGQWTYLYRAIDNVGATVEFWLRANSVDFESLGIHRKGQISDSSAFMVGDGSCPELYRRTCVSA